MKKILLLTLLFSLFGCQQTTKKIDRQEDIIAILTNITIDALKEQNFQLATRSINAIILSNDDKSWDFIQSALISLPKDASEHIIKSALTLGSVKSSPVQLFAIAKIFITQQKTTEALHTINKAIDLNDKNLDAIYWRARLLTIMKDYDKAEADFIHITKKAPDNQEYLGQYASYLQETKQFDKAQAMLAKQEVTAEGLFKRIVFSLQNQSNSKANELYNQLKNLKVDEEEINHQRFLTAEAAYWLKKHQESEEYYRKVSGGKDYLDARDMLSIILFEDKRYDESIEILHQLQNAEEKFAIKAYRLETQIFQQQNNTEQAVKTLTRSLQMLPKNPELLLDRAMLFESLNKMDDAEKDLLQILKDDPNNYDALNTLGYSLADHDLKLDEAHEYIKKASKLAPENPAIIDSLGWIQFKLGLYDEAETNIRKAIEIATKKKNSGAELYYHLYKILIKQDKTEDAQLIISKAKELFPKSPLLLKLDK